MRIFFKFRVEGKDNLPSKGPFIIASNHSSFLDPVATQAAIPPKISWITKKAVYEHKHLRLVHWVFDSIPVNGSIKKALDALEEGRVVGIFPEGTRSLDGRMKEANKGIAVLALKSGKPVVPVGIKGSFEAFPPGKKFFKPCPITVKIGKPFSFKKRTEEIIEEPLIEEKKDYIAEKIKEILI